jgi:hypothetical protein
VPSSGLSHPLSPVGFGFSAISYGQLWLPLLWPTALACPARRPSPAPGYSPQLCRGAFPRSPLSPPLLSASSQPQPCCHPPGMQSACSTNTLAPKLLEWEAVHGTEPCTQPSSTPPLPGMDMLGTIGLPCSRHHKHLSITRRMKRQALALLPAAASSLGANQNGGHYRTALDPKHAQCSDGGPGLSVCLPNPPPPQPPDTLQPALRTLRWHRTPLQASATCCSAQTAPR